MDWIAACMLMFVFSVLTYLSVRKSTLLNTPTQLNNLAMFLIPFFIYVSIVIITRERIGITWYQFWIILVSAIFFSYLGNMLSLKSMEYAANPGYSLILSKSYVVFTTLASILLFGSELTIKSAIAILVIIGFSALIMIDKTKVKHIKYSSKWLPLSIGAFFCWGMLALSLKYLQIIGVSVVTRLFYLVFIVSLITLGEIAIRKIKLTRLSKSQLVPLILIGVFSTGFNYFMNLGYNIAPNVGYVSSISALTLFSALLFRDELNPRKIVGMFGVTAGLIMLFI
jgi:drug/metabolite transporter (DMT)-like permease